MRCDALMVGSLCELLPKLLSGGCGLKSVGLEQKTSILENKTNQFCQIKSTRKDSFAQTCSQLEITQPLWSHCYRQYNTDSLFDNAFQCKLSSGFQIHFLLLWHVKEQFNDSIFSLASVCSVLEKKSLPRLCMAVLSWQKVAVIDRIMAPQKCPYLLWRYYC